MHTFSSLLEVLDEDFANNSSMANRELGQFVAGFVMHEPVLTGHVVIRHLNHYFWGDQWRDHVEPLTELMQRLSRPNGFDFTDVSTHLLERRSSPI